MAEMKQYKCPCCGGAIAFNSASQAMKCPYCDTEFDVETLENYTAEVEADVPDQMDWDTSHDESWGNEETLNTYICRSCGGEIVCDENTAATSCPYCGNAVVLSGRVSGALRPDLVIPFKLDKKQAKEALLNHYKGKRLLPREFRDENHLDEIRAIYVPFWLYDADAHANMRYKATRIRCWSDMRYDYTETSYFALMRAGTIDFANVPADASTKMDDTLMDSIEPFDYSEAVDFNSAYLAGYLADKYDVDAGQNAERANERIRQSTRDAFAATVMGYTSVIPEYTGIRLQNAHAKYALLPVWILNTTWRGKPYSFAMNGQTGKFVGDLPMDKGAFFRWFVGLTASVGVLAFAAQWLMQNL